MLAWGKPSRTLARRGGWPAVSITGRTPPHDPIAGPLAQHGRRVTTSVAASSFAHAQSRHRCAAVGFPPLAAPGTAGLADALVELQQRRRVDTSRARPTSITCCSSCPSAAISMSKPSSGLSDDAHIPEPARAWSPRSARRPAPASSPAACRRRRDIGASTRSTSARNVGDRSTPCGNSAGRGDPAAARAARRRATTPAARRGGRAGGAAASRHDERAERAAWHSPAFTASSGRAKQSVNGHPVNCRRPASNGAAFAAGQIA